MVYDKIWVNSDTLNSKALLIGAGCKAKDLGDWSGDSSIDDNVLDDNRY